MCDLSGTMGKDREKRVQEQTGIALFFPFDSAGPNPIFYKDTKRRPQRQG